MKENLSFIPYVNEETLSNEIDSSRVRSYPLHCLKKSSTTLVTTSSALSNFTSPLNTLTLLFTPPHFDSFILNTSSTYASIHISTSNKTHPQNSSLSITSPRSSVLHPTSFCLKLHVSENNFSFESSLVHAIQHLNLNSNKNLDLKNVNESDASSSAFLAELSTPVFDLIFKDATINQPVYISFPFNDVPNAEDVEVYFTDVHSNGLLMDPRFSALLPLLPSLIMNQWVYEHTCAWIPDLLSLSGHTSLCVHIFPKPNTVLPQRLTASTQVHLKTHFQPHFLHFSRYSKWECLASMEKRVGPHIEPLMHQLLEWIQGFLDGNMQHALIHGPSGSGKSFFIRHFAIASDLPYRYFSSPYDFTEVEAFLLTPPLFPALIILDDLAHLSDIQVDHLTYLLDTCTSMLVLGITSTDLPVSLASPHRPSRRFQRKWKFPSLSVQARKHLFLQPFTSFSSSVLQKGIQKTQGWSPSDIKRLLSMATHLHNSSSKESWDTCFLKSLESIQPASFTSYSTKIPKVQFEDLCGFENIIQDLKETILIPFSKKYLDFSCLQEHPHDVLSPIRGIVIHGLPGTGKSHLAYAIVNFLGFHCIAVDSTYLISKMMGESEKRIADLFETAQAHAPCFILLDQFETLCAHRGSTSSSENSGDRIVATFLMALDRLMGCMVIAITQHINLIDSAILRPGRLEYPIHLPLPDVRQRLDLVHHFCKLHPNRLTSEHQHQLATLTDKSTPADLQALFHAAAMMAIRQNEDYIEWQHFDL